MSATEVKPTELAIVEVLVEVVDRVADMVVVMGAEVRVTVAAVNSVEVVENVSVIVLAVEMIVVVS